MRADTMNITFNCGSKTLIFEMRIWNHYAMEGVDNGVAVYSSEWMVQIGRWAGKSGSKVFDRKGQEVLFDNMNEPDSHARNFHERVISFYANDAQRLQTACIPACSCIARPGFFQ
jgi:hypothetical protein